MIFRTLTSLRTPALFVAVVIISALVVGWFSRGFVRAYVEIKHAQVFATATVADGWDSPQHALALDLPADAPFESFSSSNSASIEISSPTSSVLQQPQAIPVFEPTASDAPSEPEPAPVIPDAAPTEATPDAVPVEVVPDVVPSPAPVESVTPSPDVPAAATPTSLRDTMQRFVDLLVPHASVVYATSSAELPLATTTDADISPQEVRDVAVCSVLGTTCHTIEFSGFAVSGSLTDKKFKGVAVNFSFANRTPEDAVGEDTLAVRYFHDGQWRQAGQIFLNKELSNAANGSYFSASLDDLTEWDDLSDVKVILEYLRVDDARSARLFLDAVWLDASYQERAQDVLLTGDAPTPADAPENVAFSLTTSTTDKPRILALDGGGSITFPFTDSLRPDALSFRTDASTYVPSATTTGYATEAYVSITNVRARATTVRFSVGSPESVALAAIAQYMRNVPVVSTSTAHADVTYFCESGWATTTPVATCMATEDTHTCAELSDDGRNCTVRDEVVPQAPSTAYQSAWVPVGLTTEGVSGEALPTGYMLRGGTDRSFELLPHQTIYLRLTFTTQDQAAARFVLMSEGDVSASLDSSRISDERTLRSAARSQERSERAAKRASLNDQLSDATEFDANTEPHFRFRFRTQRPFFTRVKDAFLGNTIPFKVQEARLVHEGGSEEHVPVDIEYGQNDEWTMRVEKPPRAFRPGRYSVELTMDEGGGTYADAVEFYWGVLAVNTDKSPYAPGETAHLSLAALDDGGNTICDARLTLSITSPSGSQADVPVSPGGTCNKNNVTDVPDYLADYPVEEEGVYDVTLSRLDESGAVIATTDDTFVASATSTFSIRRNGPTRIYPPSPYTMRLSVHAEHAFQGTLREAIPEGFEVKNAGGATVTRADNAQYLSWDVSLGDGETKEFSYQFKAPDVSPYLFLLGSATLSQGAETVFDEGRSWKIASDAVAISTGVAWLSGDRTTNGTNLNSNTPYPLQWNLTEDYDTTYYSHSTTTNSERLTVNVAGDYLVALTVPIQRADTTGNRTTLESDVRVNGAKVDVGVGRSAFIRTSGSHSESSDHLYVLLRNLAAGDYIESHVANLTASTDNIAMSSRASLYAEYVDTAQQAYFAVGTTTTAGTDLNPAATSTMVWYDNSLGRKDSNFTHSNISTTTSNKITLGAAGDYLVFVNIPLDDTSATNNVSVRGSVLLNNMLVPGGFFRQGYIDTAGAAQSSIHWSGVVHATTTNTLLTVGVIADANTGAVTTNGNNATIYIQQLPSSDVYVASSTALSGGTNWNVSPAQSVRWTADALIDTATYTHSTSTNAQNITVKKAGDYLLTFNDNVTAAITRANEIVQVYVNGATSTGLQTKTNFIRNTGGHNDASASLVTLLRDLAVNDVVSIVSLIEAGAGTASYSAPAVVSLWHKQAQSSYIQDTQRWYANTNAQTPTDAWPVGATDLDEGDTITSGNPIRSGDVVRLRMALLANANTVASADAFKLQYAAGSTCSPALSWTDVGATGSGSIWRGYDNGSVSAGSTLSTRVLTVSDVSETYEEQNPSASAPNALTAGQDGEWDWAIEDNGAPTGTDYCFRMIHSNGQLLKDYTDYPSLTTNGTPEVPTQEKLFDNEKVASTTPWLEFSSSDPNGEDIHYQVQVSTDPAFGSTVIDKDSVSHFALFENITTTADKAPFNSGEDIRFKPTTALSDGSTYWWRVRAKDGSGTNTWSSWSSSRSFTVDTALTVTTWYQTTDAQFDTDTLTNLATSSNTLVLSGSNTSGTVYSPEIEYAWKTAGNSWGSVSWHDTEVGGTLLYQVEYFASTSVWTLIPNTEIAGNSTGTTTSPISLSGLDTAVYDRIRVKASFAKTSASPVLSDWTVSWALSVSAPSQTALFDNEKSGTTTPTFTFTSTDPQGDDLVYQMQWSTDSTFTTGVTTKTSDTDSGFANTVSSGDTSPFTQNNKVSYTVPIGSALTNGTTYWWRVRAKDPLGGNAYSLWSSSRGLTIDTSVTVSTWFQTTNEQFLTDALDRVIASGGGATVSTDVGKIAIYREATAADAITTATYWQNFDTVVRQDDIYSMTGSTTVKLKQGHYAVLYGTRFNSTSGTNRSEIQSMFDLASTTIPIGWSQGFIRRSGTATQGFTSGGGIIYAAADNTDFTLQSFRTDANTTAGVQRAADTAGLQLIRLDDTWDYIRLSKTAKQTGPISTSNWTTVTYDREDEVDTDSFTHTQGSGNIILRDPGHYLVFANTYGSLASGSTNETMVRQRLALNGAEIDGSYTTVYMRGNTNSNGCYQGAAAIGMIVQSTTTDQVLSVQLSRAIGTAAWTINANQSGTYVDRTAITIVELPEGDFVRLGDSGTGNMNPAALTAFTWNTEPEKDTGSFSHSTVTNASRITSLIAGDYLFLGSLYAQSAGVTNANYRQGWRRNGGTLLTYGQSGGYSSNTTTSDDGNWAGTIFPSMVNGDYAEIVVQALGSAGTVAADKKSVQAVRISSLAEANPTLPTMESDDIVFSDGAGPKWSQVAWSTTTPGSTSIEMQVLYASSTADGGYALIPDSDLSGNSAGITNTPIDISNLNRLTYPTLRLRATFLCASGLCPTLNDWSLRWSAGITISGTAKQFDQTTNVTSGTVAVAVNGVVQAGKTGTISGGTWSIANVTAFTGDVITVFISGASDPTEAVAVTKYTTVSDVSGMKLYERHLTLGSNDTPLLTNADIGAYDNSVSGNEDIFFDVSAGNTLTLCALATCYDARLLVQSGTTYRPDSGSNGAVTVRHFQNDGVFIADANAITLSGSWRNSGNFVAGTSAVTFSATSTTETIDNTGATSTAFSTLTFGSGSGSATWNLTTALYASSTLSINFGTLNQNGAKAINLSGSLAIGASGLFTKGTASTTFMGSGASTWSDASAAKQDMGTIVIDGSAKTVSMGSNVKATDVTIGGDDTLSAGSNYAIEVKGNWANNNVFAAQAGTVTFSATSAGKVIAPGASSFYGLTFNGVGGNWSFATSSITVTDTFTIATGTVTLASATTTVGGTFDNTGGAFMHNNGVVALTSSATKNIRAGGSDFYDLSLTGSGTWTMLDTNATTTRHLTISAGSVTLPAGTLALGGSFLHNAGSFTPNGGTLRFTASGAQTVKLGGTDAAHITFAGPGSWTFSGSAATTTGSVRFESGSVTLPAAFAVGGSFISTSGSFTHNSGLVRFVSASTGNTIDPGASNFYDVEFNNASGGWTISNNATSTHAATLAAATSFTLAQNKTFEVDGTFQNLVGGSATSWATSTLYLNSGTAYSLDTKSAGGDIYGTLALGGTTKVRMWNSSSATTTVPSTASLYSQNHAGVSGALYIWGTYTNSGDEYWTHANDFDGTALGGGSRQVNVRLASSTSVTVSSGTFRMLGIAGATTTIDNQGSGAYSLAVTGGTLNAQYYQMRHLYTSGLSLSGTPTVTSLSDGDLELSQAGGALMSLASTVIDQNPGLQIQRMRFATSTAITGFNVVETGTPSSYWWFKNHVGNLASENFDSDPGGNPGYVRWDDSGYDISVAGHVYADHGATAIGNPPCDGTQKVKLVVDYGATTYTTSCNALTGAFTFPSVTFVGDVTLTTFLDTSGGAQAVTVTRTPTTNITDLDLYRNAVIVRHEDVLPISIAQLARFDATKDADVPFVAATSTTDTLLVRPDTELFVWGGKTFAPAGDVTVSSGGSGSLLDGRLWLAPSSTFTAAGTQSHTLGGSLYVGTSSSLSTATAAFSFVATTTGKSIYSAVPLTFYDLTFNGTGGTWSHVSQATATTTVSHALALTAGTLQGTGDLVVQSGNLAGSGVVSMSGGTTRLEGTGNLGNANQWQFYDLVLGNGAAGAMTKTGAGTTTITHALSIAANYALNAGAAPWVLSGSGTPFSTVGTFTAQTAPFFFTASSATNIPAVTFASLALVPAAAGSPTYTLLGGTLAAATTTIGDGTHAVTVTADTNDPAFAVADLAIATNATLVASNVGAFDVSGSWTNAGTFTHSSGQVRFTAPTTGKSLTTNGSPFYNLLFDSTSGGWTITDNATSTHDTTINNATSLTLTSGRSLAVGGTFTNSVGGAATTWTGSTLFLNSGTSYNLNTKSVSGDTYGTLLLGPSTNVRLWNSSATVTTVPASASLYSQDHAGVDGSLYIYGSYTRSSGSDYWSYATDFDGTALGGSARAVDVRIASSSSAAFSGGLLDILGAAGATTTVRNQGTGFYSLGVSGGTLNAGYFSLRDTDASGLSLSGAPTIASLSDGDFELAYPGGSSITVAGSVITANPLKITMRNRFATTTAIAGYNVTATGSTASSWKFNLHYGNLAGEQKSDDPAGDPGYLRWDDSASAITVAGNVYSDEGTTASPACDGWTQNVKLVVEGTGTFTSSCSASTGAYAIIGVTFNPGDTLTLYIDGVSGRKAATVSVDPVSNIGNMNLYENRVIVRHEDTSPLTIARMAVYDADNDADIPFTATDSSTDTLVLPPNTKLIVWSGKTFAPAGNVSLQSGNSNAWDGTLELQSNAVFSAAGTQSHSIGGSLVVGTGASITPANATFTFAATTTGKTLAFGPSGLYNAVFDGAGGNWSFTSSTASTTNNFTITAGTVTLPTATTTIGGSFTNDGAFMHNNGTVDLVSTASGKTVKAGGSNFYNLTFDGVGGAWAFTDTNATSSSNLLIAHGSVTLPSGVLAVGSSLINAGTFTSGTGTVRLTAASTGKAIVAGGSDFYTLVFDGIGGAWTFADASATTTRDFIITNGSTTLPTVGLAVGGSFTNAGTFTAGNSTVRLFATATGKSLTTNGSPFYNLLFDSTSGGWTITDNATSTHDTTINNATSLTLTSGRSLAVGGTFTNSVGGAATTWTGSTLFLNSGTSYNLNTKSVSGDTYGTLLLGPSTNVRLWNSSATVTTVPASASLYSQDHAGVDGSLYIYGSYTRSSGSDYWSYATDFDGTALGGSSRQVTVAVASSSVITYQSGSTLTMIGTASATSTVTNQGSNFYSMALAGGTLNASYYAVRNTDASGLTITGTPVITSLSNGDFELAYPGGSSITVAGSAIDANASQSFTGLRFATTTAIAGYNVTRTGSSSSAWSFLGAIGNLVGEAKDSDGIDACGTVRWSDSSCLFVSQEHFRWRNDDGGVGVPTSEWYNASWSKRKTVVVENPNAQTYTDVPVKLVIDYDADMRSDFADLRFTDADGVTLISHWSESAISSASTTMWVKIPDLPASGSATVYMYYGNAGASSASDGSSTFTHFEDFESASLASYSGNTSLFHIGTSFNHNHTYGLDAGSNSNQKTTTGMYRSSSLFGRDSTIRFFQYVDATQQDEPCALFGVHGSGQNYAVCLDRYPADTVEIAKDVTSNEDSGTVLATTSVSYTTGWYEVVIDWLSSNAINVRVYNAAGATLATVSTSDSTYTTAGGLGFSYWFQHGGWDFYTARPYVASTPTYVFGSEQVAGGATWAAAEDTLLSGATIGSNIRLRFSIQNTGAPLSSKHFRLQVAPLGSSLSCESVSHGTYSDVPTTSSGCGSAVACMKTTAQYSDQVSIGDLLTFPSSLGFVAGYASEDPSNQTSGLSVSSNAATEVEYNFQFTNNATNNAYCLRVSDSGSDIDNYQHVAKAVVLHAPLITDLSLNSDGDIALTEGATTTIYASSTVTDYNGYADITNASSSIFRSGAGAMCTPNDNTCYQVSSSSCAYSNCSGSSCTLRCRADIQYIADPTDAGSTYDAQNWFARLFLQDSTGLTALATSSAVDVLTLRGLEVATPAIDFGSLAAGSDTGSVNAATTLRNTGNTPIGIQVAGTDLAGTSSTIPVGEQKYATTTFAYGSCSVCQFLTGSATNVDVALAKPTATTTPVVDDIYWGIAVPNGTDTSTHQGTNTFIATSP